MTSIAFVFPGQGSQSVGMGRAVAAVSPAAAAVFAAADDALGESISTLAWDGPEDVLNRTENAQPALLATSIAYLVAASERAAAGGHEIPAPAFIAGHSMGQYSAMVAAGALDLADGVRLVRERGIRMQASGAGRDGAMAAVLGLDDAAIPELVRQASAHGVFAVANRNSPGQVVVSGERAAIDAGSQVLDELGAGAVGSRDGVGVGVGQERRGRVVERDGREDLAHGCRRVRHQGRMGRHRDREHDRPPGAE